MRLSAEEWARIEALTDHYGISAVAVVRMLVKEKARELGLEQGAKPVKKKAAKKR